MSDFTVTKVKHIREHPEEHRHTFQALLACCMDPVYDALDLPALDAHSRFAPVGMNGDLPCDSTEGPCSCGASH